MYDGMSFIPAVKSVIFLYPNEAPSDMRIRTKFSVVDKLKAEINSGWRLMSMR